MTTQRTEGPHVAVAVICEKVLKEVDTVTSLIRVIDRITVHADGLDAPAQMPTTTVRAVLVLNLKAGAARGRHSLRIELEEPSGQSRGFAELPALFEGDERGVEIITHFSLDVTVEGLYWFDVRLGDRPLTRVPLRIAYQPVRSATQQGVRVQPQ